MEYLLTGPKCTLFVKLVCTVVRLVIMCYEEECPFKVVTQTREDCGPN